MVSRILGWRENLPSSAPKSKCGESSKESSSPKGTTPSTCVFFTWYSSSSPHHHRGNRKNRNKHRNKQRHHHFTGINHHELKSGESLTSSEDTLSASMSSESSPAPLEQDNNELLMRLKAQLEFYFSVENLSRDTYLRSLLSSSSMADAPAAPLAAIANFPKVRALINAAPEDTQLLQRSIESSAELALSPDKQWIIPLRPLPPLEVTAHSTELSQSSSSASLNSSSAPTAPMPQHALKNVIIVSNVPASATPQQIISAFSISDIQPLHVASADATNSTWYLTFQTETDAIKVLEAAKDVTIDGANIKATIKTDNIPPAAAVANVAPNVAPNQQLHGSHAHVYHAHIPYPHPHPHHHLHHSMPPMYPYPPQQAYHPHPQYPHSQSLPPQPVHHHPHPYPPHLHEVPYAHHHPHHHYPQHAPPVYHHAPHDGPHPMHLQHHAPHAVQHSQFHYAPYPLPHANVPPPSKTSRKGKKDRKKNNSYRNESPVNHSNTADKKALPEHQKGSSSQKSMKEGGRMEAYSHPKMMKTSHVKQMDASTSSSSMNNGQGNNQPFHNNKFKPSSKKGKKQYYNNNNNATPENIANSTEAKRKEEMKDTDLKCNVNFPALGGGNNDDNKEKGKEDGNIKGYAQALLRSSVSSSTSGRSSNRKNSQASCGSSVDGLDMGEEEVTTKSVSVAKEMDSVGNDADEGEATQKMDEMKLVNGHSDSSEGVAADDTNVPPQENQQDSDQEQCDNVTKSVAPSVVAESDNVNTAQDFNTAASSSSADMPAEVEHKDLSAINADGKEAVAGEVAIRNNVQANPTEQQSFTNTPSKQVVEEALFLSEEDHPPLPTQKLETNKDRSAVAKPAGAWGKRPSFVDAIRNES